MTLPIDGDFAGVLWLHQAEARAPWDTPGFLLHGPELTWEQAEQVRQDVEADARRELGKVHAGTKGDDTTAKAIPGQRSNAGGVYLRGLLPPSVQQPLEERLADRLADLHAGGESNGTASALTGAVCVTTSPGLRYDIGAMRNVLDNPPTDLDPALPLRFALVSEPTGDLLTAQVHPWQSRSPTLARDEVRIGLGTAVGWAKQIVAWSTCPPHHHQYVRRDSPGLPVYMTVTGRDGVDAIVFRKPKIFGIWFDLFYHDAAEFIDVLGGRTVDYMWWMD